MVSRSLLKKVGKVALKKATRMASSSTGSKFIKQATSPQSKIGRPKGATGKKRAAFGHKKHSQAARVKKMIKTGYLRSAQRHARMGNFGRAKKMYNKARSVY